MTTPKENNIHPVEKRIKTPGPKRILALDGGGIRGALTLGFLDRIEQILRDRYQNPNFRLHQYFDLIGGTSTGSIIASALAIGMEVREIRDKYMSLGKKVFGDKRFPLSAILGPKFESDTLEEHLEEVFGDITLGDKRIKTGLCIVTKRVDTGSTWPLINNPMNQYYPHNKDIFLKDIIRASTAAPTYFFPELFNVMGKGQKPQMGAFVDGGVSMFNNPALQLFLMAVIKGFEYNWPTGKDRLMLVSVGTGSDKTKVKVDNAAKFNNIEWATRVPDLLMYDASQLGQILLQLLAKSPTRVRFDSLMRTLEDNCITTEPLLHYLRYDAPLNPETLKNTGKEHLVKDLEDLREMSNPKYRRELFEIGDAVARKEVEPGHFPDAFNLKLVLEDSLE